MAELDKPILDACCGGRMFWFNKRTTINIYSSIKKYNFAQIQSYETRKHFYRSKETDLRSSCPLRLNSGHI